MSSEEGAPDQVVGRRPVMSRRQERFFWPVLVLYFAGGVALVVSGHLSGVTFIGLSLFYVAMGRRPLTVVDSAGVRRPWRRPSTVSWSAVQHVMAPEQGIASVRLRTRAGSIISLHDVPAEESAAVAALGGVLVAPPPRPVLSAPQFRPPTDRDVEADVARRAKALSDRAEVLDAEYRRIRGSRPA